MSGSNILSGQIGQLITWTCRHPNHAVQSGTGAYTIAVADVRAALLDVELFLTGNGLDGKAIVSGVVRDMLPADAFRRGLKQFSEDYHVKMISEDYLVRPSKSKPTPPTPYMRFQFTGQALVQYHGREEYAYARETVLSLNKLTGVVTDEDPPVVPTFPARLPLPALPEEPYMLLEPTGNPALREAEEAAAWAYKTAHDSWDVDCSEILDEYEARQRVVDQAYDVALADYKKKLTIRQNLVQQANDAVRQCMGIRTGRDISRYVDILFRRSQTFCVPLSAHKGLFFVGQEHIQLVNAVERFLDRVGGKMTRIDVAQSEGNRQSIGEAIRDKIASLVKEHDEAIAAFSDKTRGKTMKEAAAQIQLTRTRLEAYIGYLEGDVVQSFREALRECDEKVEKALDDLVGAAEEELQAAG